MGTAIAHAQPRLPSWKMPDLHTRQATAGPCVTAPARMPEGWRRMQQYVAAGPGEATRARQVAAGRPARRRASHPRRRLRARHRRRVHLVGRDRRGAGRDRRRVVLARAGRPRRGHDPRRRRDGPQRHAAPVRGRGAPALAGAGPGRAHRRPPGACVPRTSTRHSAQCTRRAGVRRRRGRSRHHALHRGVRRVRPAVRPGLRAGPRRHRGARDHGASAPAAPRRRRPPRPRGPRSRWASAPGQRERAASR